VKRRYVTATALFPGLMFAVLQPIVASADVTQCMPVTVDGAPAACVSVSTTQQPLPNGDEEIDATVTVQVAGQEPVTQFVPLTLPTGVVPQPCTVSGQLAYPKSGQPDAYGYAVGWISFGIGLRDSRGCEGLIGVTGEFGGRPLTVTPPTVGTGTPLGTIPYHVPQICLMTTGSCVGPFDGSITPIVPVVSPPTIDQGSAEECIGPFEPSSTYPGEYTYDDSLCEVLPVGTI
jgi:hypothetical protein